MGSGVLFSLARLANELNMEIIWGEATANSSKFYEKVLNIRPVKDLFIIERQIMRDIAGRYFDRQERRLAKAPRKEQIL